MGIGLEVVKMLKIHCPHCGAEYTLIMDLNGKADTESFKAELVKAVEAARAVLEEAEESQLSFSSLYSALLEHLLSQPRSGVRDGPR